MIVKLKGTVSYWGKDFIFLDVGAIGYKLVVPDFAVPKFSGGAGPGSAGQEEITLYTHEINRDDAHELFGFSDIDALELFWKLISISGVGPRGAQKIVFAGTGSEVREKIMDGDLGFLQSVPGIGKKTAQKIILELKGVLAETDEPMTNVDEDAVEALIGLGYKRKEAVRVIEGLEGSTEEKIKKALKAIAR